MLFTLRYFAALPIDGVSCPLPHSHYPPKNASPIPFSYWRYLWYFHQSLTCPSLLVWEWPCALWLSPEETIFIYSQTTTPYLLVTICNGSLLPHIKMSQLDASGCSVSLSGDGERRYGTNPEWLSPSKVVPGQLMAGSPSRLRQRSPWSFRTLAGGSRTQLTNFTKLGTRNDNDSF